MHLTTIHITTFTNSQSSLYYDDYMLLNTSYLLILAAVLLILLIIWVVRLETKLRRLMGGKNASTLEHLIQDIHSELQNARRFRDESARYLETVERRLRRSIQGVETLRFNPFQGSGFGGNQSFSTALANEEGDGVILYSRERTSVYSKPLKNFSSEHELSDEEKKVIEQVQKRVRV